MTMFRRRTEPTPLVTLPTISRGILQVCHPDWRGVRASAYAFGDPVLEASDLTELATIVSTAPEAPDMVVIQGWPPGAKEFVTGCAGAGITVLAIFHSAPTQHGVDAGEAEAVSSMVALAKRGVVSRIGTVKAGLAASFAELGIDIVHVPNRVPIVDAVIPAAVPTGPNVGVFLAPFWRKNVTTQVLAAVQNGWRPFVMERPAVPYLASVDMVETGELSHDALLAHQAAMDIAFNVTLSECHPMMPMEAYRLGVPCLMSRTSDLFAGLPDLASLTTVAEADDPEAIARAGLRLLDHRDEAVEMANHELDRIDVESATRWDAFVAR
ncbi:MAG: hypothetical protein KDB69_04845 [Acidimicrobiia bacterium]|nr:hypothetical protein [Acidimicrobiia bacterium]